LSHSFLSLGYQSRVGLRDDCIEKYATEIVLEEVVMLDKMPEDVKDILDLKDTSDGAPAQQV
jgi:hypothetical protein